MTAAETTLLEAGEPAPCELVNAAGAAPFLLVCDHASNRVPRRLAGLGLSPQALQGHIAWDIGAAPMTRRLSECLDAPALLAGYSRLVVDCNRYPQDPAAFAGTSDGTPVPGNANLSRLQKQQRLDHIYRPYHDRIETMLENFAARGIAPALVSVHTMTARMQGGAWRPQEFTLCWAEDDRLARPVLERMDAAGKQVGDNVPYSLDIGLDYTVPEHAMRRGLAHLQIEVRQDLVDTRERATAWADLIAETIGDLVTDEALRRPVPCQARIGWLGDAPD